MSRAKLLFFWTFMMQNWLHKFNCFSLFRAKKINSFLLWTMMGSLFATWFIMYVLLEPTDEAGQWKTFFINNGLALFGSSVIVFCYFKDTRNAGIATAWMLHSGILFFAAMFGFHMQIFWYKIIYNLALGGIVFYIGKNLYDRANTKPL